jgi:ribonuclease D
LIEIRNWLAGELKQAGRWEIAQEDFRRAAQAYQRPERDRLPACWRQQGARDLHPQQGAVLKELNAYRDRIARERDVPLFKVLGNKTLLALAEESPTTRKELQRANIPHKKQAERLGEGLLQAVRDGLEAPPYQPPRRPRPDDAYLARERALKDWRKAKAREAGLNSAVILPRYLLEELARENPRTREELAEILEEEVPLRFAHYGGELLQVLSRA